MMIIIKILLYHDDQGEDTRTIRILIISALWHISTALANLLTGYILQVYIQDQDQDTYRARIRILVFSYS